MAEEIVTGILVKTSKETPLQGKVINTVDTPYPEENAYSVDMIKKMLVPPFNLLVNPDFQCNQRGQSEYNFDTTGKYGIDMWMHRQGNYSGALIVSPLKGGGCHIELSAGSMGGLRQYLDKDIDDLKIGQKYTAVISIDNVRYKGTITLQSSNNDIKIIDNDLLSITFYHNSNDKRVYYSLWFKNAGFECDINYADLFEGETDYPHIKEDYSIALLRCQRFLFVTSGSQYLSVFYGGSRGSESRFNLLLPTKMKGTPTIIYDISAIFNMQSRGDIEKELVNLSLASLNYSQNAVITITKKDSSNFDVTSTYVVVVNSLIISCEPL